MTRKMRKDQRGLTREANRKQSYTLYLTFKINRAMQKQTGKIPKSSQLMMYKLTFSSYDRLLKLLTSNQRITIKGRKLFAITDLIMSDLNLVISSLLAHKMARPWKQSDTCSWNNLGSLRTTSRQQICKRSAKDSFVILNSDKEIAAGG